jgi:hypothetical protein
VLEWFVAAEGSCTSFPQSQARSRAGLFVVGLTFIKGALILQPTVKIAFVKSR